MSSQAFNLLDQHAGFYRPVEDLSVPWVGSPELDKPKTLASLYFQQSTSQNQLRPHASPIKEESTQTLTTSLPLPQRRRFHALARFLRRLADKINGEPPMLEHPITPAPAGTTNEAVVESDEVPLRDWKAWGYYACPKILRDHVVNYPPAPQASQSVDVEEVFQSLVDASNNFRPDRWIRGLEHPALPPRPERWKAHPKNAPLPFPWQCQLNPLLQHSSFGRPPLDWKISNDPRSYCYLGRTEPTLPASPADLAQPATYPFVTHMYINSLAEDPYPECFWPFYVVNEHGVTVKDVLEKIYENFQQHIGRLEYESWGNFVSRQRTTQIACGMRVRNSRDKQARRIDVLGTQLQFRGLEPHPNREGWSIFLGLG